MEARFRRLQEVAVEEEGEARASEWSRLIARIHKKSHAAEGALQHSFHFGLPPWEPPPLIAYPLSAESRT